MRRPIPPRPAFAALLLLALAPALAHASRLARDVAPTFEAVKLWVNADQSEYRGEARIELHAERPAASFRFHAQGLVIERLTLSGARGAIGAKVSGEEERAITVTPETPLAPGDYTLEIAFKNAFNTRAASLYKLFTRGKSYTFTQFEADDARGAFPCWDEPSFKIPWQLTLVVPKRHLAFSNTPIERESEDGAERTVVFKRTPPLPAYLVALATGPFDVVEIPGLGVPGHVITIKGQGALAAEAVRITPPLLRALEDYFGRPYPFEKCDLIAVPEYWYGAMENPGLITYRDNLLLLDPKRASDEERSHLVSVTAHELAHMWFGDLVTMEWWDDMWLNESFASWMGDKVSDRAFPEVQARTRSLGRRNRALVSDARLSTRAMRQPVTDADNLLQLADELAYDKGQAVLEMFERFLGPDRFQAGVRRYLSNFEWSNANAADLWYALSRAGRTAIEPSMESFLDRPGVPLLTVERLGGDRVRLTQRRFLPAGVAAPEAEPWKIPVLLEYGEGAVRRTYSVMLKTEQRVVRLEGIESADWLHPNADETAYYRWSLPDADLRALIDRSPKVLTPRARAALVDNLAALLDGGELGADEYLRALERLAQDPEPEVSQRVIAAVRQARATFGAEETRSLFAHYVRRTLAPMLERVGERARPGEPPSAARLRGELWQLLGAEGEDAHRLEAAEALARDYANDPSSVEPGLVEPALKLSAIRGDRARFDDYVKRFETAELPADRERYLGALGEFRDPALADAALDYVFRGSLRPQELFEIPLAQGPRFERRQRVFEWTLEHYGDFAARIPAMFLAFMPRTASGCSLERLAVAQTFFADPAHQAPGWETEMAKVAESVRDCVRLREREGAAVVRYLQSLAPLP